MTIPWLHRASTERRRAIAPAIGASGGRRLPCLQDWFVRSSTHIMKFIITPLALALIAFAGCSTTRVAPKGWNAVGEGMTRAEIASSIGRPVSQLPSIEVWRSEDWELRIAYDQNGRATNVVRKLVLK